jgi:hypothetical protein
MFTFDQVSNISTYCSLLFFPENIKNNNIQNIPIFLKKQAIVG